MLCLKKWIQFSKSHFKFRFLCCLFRTGWPVRGLFKCHQRRRRPVHVCHGNSVLLVHFFSPFFTVWHPSSQPVTRACQPFDTTPLVVAPHPAGTVPASNWQPLVIVFFSFQDCFRARGRHVGICTKGFYFGSCCSLPTYSSSTADPPRPQRPAPPPLPRPPPPLPLTSDNLPRVPIVLESNAIDDGPAAPSSPFDPLDWSFWPNLVANIYGLKRQPIVTHKFPYSTFHGPAISGNGNTGSSVASSSTKADVTTTPPTLTTTLKTTVTTTMTLIATQETTTTSTTTASTSSC